MDLKDRFPKYSSYPPAPNWFSSNIAAVVEPNFFLYATRNIVVVLSLTDLKYFTSFVASKDKKIVALAAHENFCYTATDDKVVRVWNPVVGSLLTSHAAHEAEITSLALIRNGGTAISGDKSGKIVIMDMFAGSKVCSKTIVKSEVTSIATTVIDGQDYMAVGYANGLIFIEKVHTDLSTETVFQIAEDNDPIHAVAWQLLSSSFKQQHPEAATVTPWPLLAFSTRNKKRVCIWDFPSNSLHTTLNLPPPPTKATDNQKSSVWMTLSWSSSPHNRIYISSYVGTILCYDITAQGSKICNSERLETHSRHVFTINHFSHGKNCITTSQDKQIILWDLASKKKKSLIIMKTQAAFPYSMDISNTNHGQLAISMGDNAIKLWNFSSKSSLLRAKRSPNYYDATVLWKGLQGKIEKIRWHPTREGLLAFSNDYGHIGIYDTLQSSRQIFKITYNRGASFLDWAGDMSAALNCTEMTDTLVTCGPGGVIYAYDANNPKNEPFNLCETFRECNAAWITSLIAMDTVPFTIKIDQQAKYLAIGHDTGLVEVYALDNLKVIYVSNYQRQLITALDWKYFADKLYLASGSNDGSIAVHDISAVDRNSVSETPVPHPEPAYRINGHRKAVTEIKWSPHQDKCLLASASEDNFSIVWSIPESKAISLFNKHRNSVITLCWNAERPDCIFTGSDDRFIYEWNYTDFPCQEPLDAYVPLFDEEVAKVNANTRKRKADAEVQSLNLNTVTATTATTPAQAKKKRKQGKEGNPPITRKILETFDEAEKMTSKIRKAQYGLILADNKLDGAVKKATEYLMTTFVTEEQRKDSVISKYGYFWSNTRAQNDSQKSFERTFELFFGDKNDIRQLLKDAVARRASEQQVDAASVYDIDNNFASTMDTELVADIMRCQLDFFNKDTPDNRTCLSDWIKLALSPMSGKQKWMELMLKQAQKLEAEKQYNLAASCYIACSHIRDALELYKRHEMFQEALILAKLRLPPKDPAVPALFADWAKLLQMQNQDLLAAIAYILSDIPGSKETAINLIARTDKEQFLFYAASLSVAIDEGNKEVRIKDWLAKMDERLKRRKNADAESLDTRDPENNEDA